jgi:nitrogen regulatory protein P-II 1
MSEGASKRELELLFCVVKDYRQRDMILEGFLELGITGATIVDAHGMAQVLSKDVPIFAGLSSLFPRGSSDSSLILSVLDTSKRDDAVRLIEDVLGNFDAPGSGILFTVKIAYVRGLAEEIH